MVIIATDGAPVLPEPVDTLFSTAGERYDFVIEANQTKGNNQCHWQWVNYLYHLK